MENPAITAFISQQPLALRPILEALRQIILQEGPRIREYIQYKLPFYAYAERLCYLNPKQGVVNLGLCQGAFLSNEQGLLVGVCKEVGQVRITALADINKVGASGIA